MIWFTERWPSRSRSCLHGTDAVRADAQDSVHQMRVTTRRIGSVLQASVAAFGLSDDAWILDELRELAQCWCWAQPEMRKCWPIGINRPRTSCPRSWCAGRSSNE